MSVRIRRYVSEIGFSRQWATRSFLHPEGRGFEPLFAHLWNSPNVGAMRKLIVQVLRYENNT